MNKKNQTLYVISILFLGLRAKFISLLSKILMNRELGIEAMGIFSLVNPLIVFLISISNLSLPSAIATLVSKHPKKDKVILLSSLIIFVFLSSGLMILTFLLEDVFSFYLLKNPSTLGCIRASIIMIPLTSLSAIIKGYFLGKGEIKLTSASQTYEEAGRLLFVMIIVAIFKTSSPSIKASFAIYSLAFGEVFQILHMVLFSNINKANILPSFKRNINKYKAEIKPILNISIPLTLSKLVGTVTYFFEPIIFTNIMLKNNVSVEILTIDYGILSSYVMPLLFMPSFISVALSNYLLSTMGKLISNNKVNNSIKLLLKIIIISLIIGLSTSLFFYIFGEYLLIFLYGSNIGIDLLKILCFPFIIYYIETPIITALNIFELNKKSFISTVISSIVRLILLIPFVKYFGVLGISFATLISIIIDIGLNVYFLFIHLKRNKIYVIN